MTKKLDKKFESKSELASELRAELNLERVHQILREQFSLTNFRTGQQAIISSVLQGRDALAVLPTGGGKSLCYQLPTQYLKKLTVVVSPLIALMKDQVAGLNARGLLAGALYSGQGSDEKRRIFAELNLAIRSQRGFILYLSPERVQKPGFQSWLKTQDIGLIAIDEAHCVSQWGHDFREEYSMLRIFKELRPDIPILALTASATPTVLADISRQLGLQRPARHVHGFYRSNLYYQVETCADEESKFQILQQALMKFTSTSQASAQGVPRERVLGRILIYAGTRQLTENLTQALRSKFSKIGCYHAGLSSEERHQTQQDFAENKLRILVATNAFGMGVDLPDIRLVVHFNMPGNLDSLYQEMGRAGRDGKESTCLLLYSTKDKGLQAYFIQSSAAAAEIKKSRWNTLNTIIDFVEGGECRHREILTYYKDEQKLSKCGHCDTCAPKSERKVRYTLVSPEKVLVRKKNISKLPQVLSGEAELRFDLLREWRKEKADSMDVPAFVIFSDRSLREIATLNPQNLRDLRSVHGMGEVKLDRFGKELLSVLGTKTSRER